MLYRKSNKKQEGQLEAFKIWRYLSKSLESENRFKIGFCPAPSVWTHKLFRFWSFLLLCLGHCSETNWGLKGGRVETHTHLGNADTTTMSTSGERASQIPFFVPIGKDSTSWSFSFSSVKPHCTKQLHTAYHPSQGWCFMLGTTSKTGVLSYFLISFLHRNQQSSNLNHPEVAAKAEWESHMGHSKAASSHAGTLQHQKC